MPGLRILLAEDNPGDVFLVKEALRRQGIEHTLTLATNGQAAWELIEAAEHRPAAGYDLFMIDLNLPSRPGVELVARIRSSPTSMGHAPVVIVTSSSAPRDRSAADRAGANYYFCKPSNFAQFLKLGSIVEQLTVDSHAGSVSGGEGSTQGNTA